MEARATSPSRAMVATMASLSPAMAAQATTSPATASRATHPHKVAQGTTSQATASQAMHLLKVVLQYSPEVTRLPLILVASFTDLSDLAYGCQLCVPAGGSP